MSRKKSQLIVADDDEVIRRLIGIHGEKQGYQVVEAADGEEAMTLLDEETEVVLLDLNMPQHA